MLDERGHVSEGSGENIFVVHGRQADHAAAVVRHPRRHHARHRDDAGPRRAGPRGRRARHRPHGALHRRRVLHDRHRRARHAGRRAGPPGDRRAARWARSRATSSGSTSTSSRATTPSTPTGALRATQRSRPNHRAAVPRGGNGHRRGALGAVALVLAAALLVRALELAGLVPAVPGRTLGAGVLVALAAVVRASGPTAATACATSSTSTG